VEDGAVLVCGDRIMGVGPWSVLSVGGPSAVFDLGEVILLPGLINAHCHLDYTGLAGLIFPPKYFTDWIKAIVALKANWSYSDFAESWLRGAQMLLRSGVTTVADIEAVPELLPEAWNATPLRVISFAELISIRRRGYETELVDQTAGHFLRVLGTGTSDHPSETRGPPGERLGLSPHAPYSTSVSLLQAAAKTAREHGLPLTTHLAESEEEFEMFMYRFGPLYDWLRGQRDMSDCGLGSPVQHLERAGYLSAQPLVVHVNYLWRDDAAPLARRKVSVVHCPRSHDYFRHLLFPRQELVEAGVNVCLGTDSLASVRTTRADRTDLTMFAEMELLAERAPDLAPAAIVRMATANGAVALRRGGQLGQLTPGACADAIAIPYSGSLNEVWAAVVHHRGPVKASMIRGQWVIPDSSL